MEFVYTVWFRDTSLSPDDQDFEWPACIVIEADSLADSTEWGDHLSRRFAADRPNERIVRSESEVIESYADLDLTSAPRIKYGQEASDVELGW